MPDVDINPLSVAVGRAVHICRQERKLSQEALAERAGVHVTWIGRTERGAANPTLATVFRLAEALGMRPSELMARAEGLIEPRRTSRGLEAEIGWRRRESADGFD